MIHACLECAVNPYAQRYTAKKHRGRSWIDTKPQIASCILPVSASTYCCCCWHSFPYHYCLYYRLQVRRILSIWCVILLCFSNCRISLRRNTLAVAGVAAHLNHRAGEVYEVPTYEKAGQNHREGGAEASHDQHHILRLLEHGE